jgi:hypothetical protein
MYSIGIGNFGGGHDMGNIEIRIGAGGFSNTYRFIGKTHMEAILVGGRIYRNSFDAHLATGAYHP